jgi:hypothetical protein
MKVFALFGVNTTVISDPGDGTLLAAIHGAEFRFVEVEPLYFRQVGGPFALVFREDDRGRITHVVSDLMPQYAGVKLDWYEESGFHMTLVQGCLLLFLSMIPAVLIRFLWDRRLSGDRKPAARGARLAGWIILGICVLNLLFMVLFMAGFSLVFVTGRSLTWGLPSEVHSLSLIAKLVLGLGVLSAVLTVGALLHAVLAWKNNYWGVAFRAYYTLVTVAAVAFVWFLNYWNLLGWRY